MSRTAPTSGTTPDRLLGGGRVEVEVNDGLRAGATFVDLFDLDGTGSAAGLANPVASGDLRAAYRLPNGAEVGVRGEAGASRASFGDESSVPIREDYFVDAGVFGGLAGVSAAASYRDVGPAFISPAAQTRRVSYGQRPLLFPNAEGFGTREITQFDVISQEGLYNERILPQLLPYDPRLDPAEPYGQATPNRRGLSFALGYGRADLDANDAGPVYATAALDLLNEIVGEGTPETRRFRVAAAAADVRLDRLVGGPLEGRPLVLTLGVRQTQTSRDAFAFDDGDGAAVDTGAVDLSSVLVNAGLTANVTGRLDLLGGVKVLAAEGNELRALRDSGVDPFAITGFEPLAYDGAEVIYAAGARYRIREADYLLASGTVLRADDETGAAAGYRIGDLFLHYVLTF